MTTQTVSHRSEILFLYDLADANPNGDPNDENRPRMDLESGRAKVTDVRLKRTIRDYLQGYGGHDGTNGKDIFCREIEKSDGNIQEGKDRAEDFFEQLAKSAKEGAKTVLEKRDLIQAGVVANCIDVRLFGATIPVAKIGKTGKDSSVTLTGAVQFAMGTSLHRVEPRFIKGTGAFASGQGAQQKTFREEYVLPYALIAFYGVVNQQAAKTTGLTDADVEELYKAIWYGTKNLITRSKIGQRPLLLVVVDYNEPNAYIGRLDRFLVIDNGSGQELRGEQLRDTDELVLQLGKLQEALQKKKERVAKVRYAWDKRLRLSPQPKDNEFLGFPAENLNLE